MMIVAFPERSSSVSSNVVRKSKVKDPRNDMIVSFPGGRRRTEESRADALRQREGKGAGSNRSATTDRSCLAAVRKGGHKVMPDPCKEAKLRHKNTGMSRRPQRHSPIKPSALNEGMSDRKELATKVAESKARRHSSKKQFHKDKEVIVEFPRRSRRCATRENKEPHSLSGVFGKGEAHRKTSKKEREHSPMRVQRKNRDISIEKSRNRHSRKFHDAVDWRNSSVDWGDDDEMSNTDDEVSRRSFSRKQVCPCPGQSGRKRSSKDNSHRPSLGESNASLLSQSLSSLLSIRKLDP
ncbi:hypothetical protein ACHAWF_018932 [Thalassiosira exigua]